MVFDHDDHTHPGIVVTGQKSGRYDIPTIGESSASVKYRIILRVKDSAGLVRVVERDVRPKLTRFKVDSNHPGRTVRLDGVPLVTPFSRDGVAGLVRTLDAPLFQQERENSPVWFSFQSWSDGGAASHAVSLPLTHTRYTAYYKRIENPACIPFPALSRFVNMPFANQTGSFTADFDVTPTAFPVNANVALSDGPRGGLPGQAALVAFNTAGRVLVRDVTAARADVVFPYEASQRYHVRMGVNLVDHRYSVWITPPGGAEVALASNYGFRIEHAFITQLNNWGAFVSPNPSGGTVEVCNFEVNCGGDKNTPPTIRAPRDLTVRDRPPRGHLRPGGHRRRAGAAQGEGQLRPGEHHPGRRARRQPVPGRHHHRHLDRHRRRWAGGDGAAEGHGHGPPPARRRLLGQVRSGE